MNDYLVLFLRRHELAEAERLALRQRVLEEARAQRPRRALRLPRLLLRPARHPETQTAEAPASAAPEEGCRQPAPIIV
jgi:hypothetical protein